LYEQRALRLRSAVLGLVGALSVASLVGTALSPYLLVKSPLLLVAISPAAHHVVFAAATVDPLSLLVVATLRRALTGVGAFGLGVVFGRQAVGWVELRQPRMGRWLGYVEKLFTRYGIALLAVAPAPTLAFFAGVAARRLRWVLPALLVGHALWNAAAYYVGDALAARTDSMVDFLSAHLLESTLVCVAFVALQQLVRRLMRRANPAQ
jgi:hypothetical protein